LLTLEKDLDVDEVKEKFFEKGKSLDAARVEALLAEIDDIEDNRDAAGALQRRDAAQDE
jgi:hypothetical protein